MRKAFTILELLVTVTIIAVLISVASLALSRSIKYSKDVKCRSNLSQIAKAVASYEADYRDIPYSLSEMVPQILPQEALKCPRDVLGPESYMYPSSGFFYARTPMNLVDFRTAHRHIARYYSENPMITLAQDVDMFHDGFYNAVRFDGSVFVDNRDDFDAYRLD